MIWRIKKYDWSREVTWRENKSSCFPPDVVFPCRVSRHNALCCITSCYSFRYNKQLIAQLVGRHEDLSHPSHLRPRATWIFRVGQIFVSPSKLGNKCILSLVNFHVLNCLRNGSTYFDETRHTASAHLLYRVLIFSSRSVDKYARPNFRLTDQQQSYRQSITIFTISTQKCPYI